jgi:2-dehydropantoate 2-reductase
MLARAGAPVTLIGRATHVDAINREGLFIDCVQFKEHIPVSASTELEAVRGAHLVLFCVKTVDTESTAKLLAPLLGPGAILVSMQNGADNAEQIRAASGIPAIVAAVYVAAAMFGPGQVKQTGRGDLVIGSPGGCDASAKQLEEVAATFTRAGVPCRISENVTAELWEKLIINCAYNAASALSRSRYGRIVQDPEAAQVMKQVVLEAVAVAKACGIQLEGMTEVVFRLGKVMSETMSSTAQDIARGKVTEIDSLNGYIVRKGAELGVATPVNLTLHALVKLLERAPR